jgi:hypothetical protein
MSEVEDATAALAAADITSVLPPAADGEQVVTPWDVAGGADGKIDYAKLAWRDKADNARHSSTQLEPSCPEPE